MVVTYHYSCAFQPYQQIQPFFDGPLAVSLFFIMSGFVLTGGFDGERNSTIGLISGRVSRLLLPTITVVVIASVLYGYLQPVTARAARIFGAHYFYYWFAIQPRGLPIFSGNLVGLFLGFSNMSLIHLPIQIVDYEAAVPPTWTIAYEIYGSIMVLALVRLYRFSRPLWFCAITGSLFAFGISEFGLFVAGHAARIIWKPDQAEKFNVFAMVIAIAAVYALMVTRINLNRNFHFFDVLANGILAHPSPINSLHSVFGIVVFVVVTYSRWLQRALSLRPLLYLGRLSFSVYLIHWPLMLWVGSGLYLLIGTELPVTRGVIFVAGIIITIILAMAFERCVDAPAIAFGRLLKGGRRPQELPVAVATQV